MTQNLIEIGRRIGAETKHYTGGPVQSFEEVGRDALITLLRHGLQPSHKLLDFGCGSLRLGYWLIRFLDSGCYFGIEPVKKGVDAGLKHAIGDEIAQAKRPQFRFAADNDMTAFGQSFDYVIARSILTHTAPGMLATILASFAESAARGGQFLASYYRTDGDVVFNTSRAGPGKVACRGDDLPSDDMRFIWCVKYSFEYMQRAAASAGLKVSEYREFDPINFQLWLRFERK